MNIFNHKCLINLNKVEWNRFGRVATLRPVQEGNNLNFRCSYTCPSDLNCNVLTAEVEWYSNDTLITRKNAIFDRTLSEFSALLTESEWSVHMNKEVSVFP